MLVVDELLDDEVPITEFTKNSHYNIRNVPYLKMKCSKWNCSSSLLTKLNLIQYANELIF